ncbi:ceramidase domain-containing protein [Nocardioides sp.]|uniref:ceramidase domain-containing protein n=1 Tax=Nocardioides sp. TaxID=35761 RepID=UPI001A295A61|nr:ceramidase domain-containing protein [Nocardioides sp.]MBJ7359058.1 ceramidase domain-containing protein [Nocardioides sp.]
MTSPRPVALAAATAVVSLTTLVLAVRFGWLGADVDRGAEFCEAAAGRVRQPVNTLSNLGFVVAGLAIAREAWRLPAVGTAYACLVVLLGPASMAMHATESALGGHLDLLSMYLVASFAVSYAAMRVWRRGRGFMAAVFAAAVAACLLVEVAGGEVPVVMHAGNLAFGALLLAALVLERRLLRRGDSTLDRRWILAAVGALALAFAVWNTAKDGSPLCWPGSVYQGHGIWHLLCAVSAYCLFRFYASERLPRVGPAPGRPRTTTRAARRGPSGGLTRL